ncbi:ABC transporter permease [Sphingobacterium faecium]|uniref:ABC transporter permease n=1 Tax=Sphingobacterium faecium TaxID=34087 RepID=UPI00320AA719
MKSLILNTKNSPVLVVAIFLTVWFFISFLQIFPEYAFPSVQSVYNSLLNELLSLRLVKDLVASLWRVTIGFTLSAILAIPIGLYLGRNNKIRDALIPILNFFRFLSPLAWIPFAILWFHIGDKPAIFLIFMSTFFPLLLSVISSISTVPKIFFKVAKEYKYSNTELLQQILFPAILPQLLSSLRICFGISWVVIVAAEMVGCQDGLGYGIWDARNSLRLDTAVCYMITIGLTGLAIDSLFLRITNIKSIKWGYGK